MVRRDKKDQGKRQPGIESKGMKRRNWISHPHLKDGAADKRKERHISLKRPMLQSAPEEQVFREQCAHPASYPKLG